MPKESMSTEGETLQVSVLPYRCSIRPPLHRHNWLSFGKFQDTERFLIPCPRHVSPRLPPSGETCKYAMAPGTQKNLERFSTYWYGPFCCFCLGCCAADFGSSGGTYELLCTLLQRVTFASWRLFNCQAHKNNKATTMSPEVLSELLSQICIAGWNILTLPTLFLLKTTPFLKKMWKEWLFSKTSTRFKAVPYYLLQIKPLSNTSLLPSVGSDRTATRNHKTEN